jgi:hypothetical protein
VSTSVAARPTRTTSWAPTCPEPGRLVRVSPGTAESTPTTESGGEGATLAIEADPGGENAFTETELTGQAGAVTIEFANPSSKPHAVAIDGVDGVSETVTGADAPPLDGQLRARDVLLPGRQHRDDGMEGTLTVQ